VHGDIITVPEKEAFYIRGEVARPGSYFLERGMTVMQAIAVAGGLGQFANRKSIELLRSPRGVKPEKITINLKAIEDGKRADVPIQPNDLIIVPRRIF
jgi:polysaccharide export outer membrane protein